MTSRFLLPLLVATVPATAFATAQFPDRLILEDDSPVDLFCNPLEQYFRAHPEQRPEAPVRCTALWRGYVGTFRLREGRLSVEDVAVIDPRSDNLEFMSVIEQALPAPESRVMDWFTGLLIIPQGEETHYVHMGYASHYESYRLIYVRRGVVRADRNFTGEEYAEYRARQFEEFKKTTRYRDARAAVENAGGRLDPDRFLEIYEVDFASDLPLDYKDFTPGMEAWDESTDRAETAPPQ